MKGIRKSEKLVNSGNDQTFRYIYKEDAVRLTVYIMFELYLYFSESISSLFKVCLSL